MSDAPAARPKTPGRRAGIAIAIVVGGLIAINLAASGLDHAVGGNQPSGVAGSSYGTQNSGLAALTTLVAQYGHDVTRERGPIHGASFDPRDTVFVIEPQDVTEVDSTALLEFVTEGGRLVIGGTDPFYVRDLRDRPPIWSVDSPGTFDQFDASLGRLRVVDTAGDGSWSDPGASTVLAHSGGDALVTQARVGRGEMLFLADPTPLENAYLGSADNAAFALALAGVPSRPVEFVEGVHGYGERRGLGALPTPWKLSLLVLALAALAYAWSRSRRFGPPDRRARALPPPRSQYVDALACSLERTRDPAAALAPMQEWARARVAQRAHLRLDASSEDVDRAAIKLGYTEQERAAIWHAPADADAALALGRLVSKLSHQDGRST